MKSYNQQTPPEPDLNLEEDVPLTKAEKVKKFTADLRMQFVALPMAIYADVRSKKLTHRDVDLYSHLLVKQGVHRTAFWGIESLAILTGTNATTVKNSLSRLVKAGHIKRKRGNTTTHTVCLTKLSPGMGADGILVKGRKVDEMPPDEIESEPASPAVIRTMHPIPGHYKVQVKPAAPSQARDFEQDDDEPLEPF